MVCLQAIQRLGIHLIQITGIDERSIDALISQQADYILALLIERTGGDDCHLLALVHHLVLCLVTILSINGFRSMNHAIAWHADGDRFLILQNAPAEHGEILLAGGWSQIDEPRNAAEHRNIEKADVGDVVHRVHSASYHVDYGWVGIDAEVLRYLVVGTLDKGAVNGPDRMQSTLRHSRNHGHRLLFGDSHINVLLASQLALIGSKATCGRSTGGYGDEGLILLHLAEHPVRE